MKISLITINRNNAPGLKCTLASVADQLGNLPEGSELEHIIVDGQSTDGSLNCIREELNSLVVSASPNGVYDAINIGMKHSSGDIIGLLHSGDVFASPSSLADIIGYISQTDCDYIYGDVMVGSRLYKGAEMSVDGLEQGIAPPHPSLYIHRRVLNEVGFYDEKFNIAGDFDYFIRLATKKGLKGVYRPGIIVEMGHGGLSKKLINRLWYNNKERLVALRKNGLKASPFKILKHYIYIFRNILCLSKNQNR